MKCKLVILFSAVCSYCMAKDVIVTKDAQQIEARITEVSDSEVKYKKVNNLNGPTFVITTDKISTVVYENGEIQTFQSETENVSENVFLPEDDLSSVNDNQSSSVLASKSKILRTRITLPNGRRRKRYHNEENTLIMKSSEFTSYLAAYCPEAHRQLRKANGLTVGACFGVLFCMPAGIALAIVAGVKYDKVLPVYNESCASE